MIHVPTDFTSNRNPAFGQVEVERQEHVTSNRKHLCVQDVADANIIKNLETRSAKGIC
jgi:hypothetical protein